MQITVKKISRLAKHMHVEMPDGSGIAIDGGPAELLAWAKSTLRESSQEMQVALAVLVLAARRPQLRDQDFALVEGKVIDLDLSKIGVSA